MFLKKYPNPLKLKSFMDIKIAVIVYRVKPYPNNFHRTKIKENSND
jgi:hypothetical protein